VPENRAETGQFTPGTSGNPGGRPRGLARATRELLGGDGQAIPRFWLNIMNDENAKTSDRLEASKLLADRGWGKTAVPLWPEEDDANLPPDPPVIRERSPERVAELLKLAVESGLIKLDAPTPDGPDRADQGPLTASYPPRV
jgi:hypothetical protein